MLSPAVVWSICCLGCPYALLSSISAAFKLPSTAICRSRNRIASRAVLPFFSSANNAVIASRMSGILGRPFGLPDWPLTNGLRLAVRSVFFTVLPLFGHLFNVFSPRFVSMWHVYHFCTTQKLPSTIRTLRPNVSRTARATPSNAVKSSPNIVQPGFSSGM